MILLFFISLWIAFKWKGSLTKCGFIGMAIYTLLNALAASSNLQFQYGPVGGFVYGLILAFIYSVFLIWIPVWIAMARRRKRPAQPKESWDRTAIYGAENAKGTEATNLLTANSANRLQGIFKDIQEK
jgi:hypothetical protein